MLDLDNPMEVVRAVKSRIVGLKYMNLATIGSDGKPWTVVVKFSLDENFNFIWNSRRDTLHSQNVERNPEVAICVFTDDPELGNFGVYCKAVATKVEDKGDVSAYRAEVQAVWLNEAQFKKTQVDLNLLRAK